MVRIASGVKKPFHHHDVCMYERRLSQRNGKIYPLHSHMTFNGWGPEDDSANAKAINTRQDDKLECFAAPMMPLRFYTSDWMNPVAYDERVRKGRFPKPIYLRMLYVSFVNLAPRIGRQRGSSAQVLIESGICWTLHFYYSDPNDLIEDTETQIYFGGIIKTETFSLASEIPASRSSPWG